MARLTLDWVAVRVLAASVWPRGGPPCGARTRRGRLCRGLHVRGNGLCRLHGGKSTGPRTAEGLERLRAVRTRHGAYGKEACQLRELIRALKLRTKQVIELG